MGPYSHFSLAVKLEPLLQPDDHPAYLWGAVVPDIRYLANLPRTHTHLDLDRIQQFTVRYPHLRSFLSGYQVHLLVDQIDVSQTVGAAFPLNLLRKVLRKGISPQQMTMMVELYFLQRGGAQAPLSGENNEVLCELSISTEQNAVFHQALQEYFENRSFEAAVSAFQKIGMIENGRLETYLNAYRTMQKRKVLTGLIMLSIKNARLESKVIEHVRTSLQ